MKLRRHVLGDNIQNIINSVIHRFARRNGVKRISGLINADASAILKVFFENVRMSSEVICKEQAIKRKDVSFLDVVHSLKRNPCTFLSRQ